jgi:cyclic pyranopterin phosphate synthase
MLIDALSRPLRNLRLSVTDRCNLRCEYCMPEENYVWLPREDILQFEEVGRLVDIFLELGVDRLRLTGGEPLLRRDLASLVATLSAKKGLADLALTTNGVLLGEHADALRQAGLRRITVSLDTLRRDRFRALTRYDELPRVLEGIAAARRTFAAVDDADARQSPGRMSSGPGRGSSQATGTSDRAVKIDTVVIRGVNDDELADLLEYGRTSDAEVRFIEYMDVGGATRWTPSRVVSKAEILERLTERYGPIEALAETSSAPAERFVLRDGVVFGIIASTTEPFCRSCDRSRLTADGMWYMCLYATEGLDLRDALRGGASATELRDLVAAAWRARQDRGAETRLALGDRRAFVPITTLRRDPHLEMHTRGG